MRVVANGIGIEVDDAGPADGVPVLLVMGLAMQLVAWPDELLAELRQRGFRPIRFDNRDIGLSQWFDALGVPSVAWAALRYGLRLPVRAPYSLADMAADTVGVLDALGLPRVHLCGASMGGMIAQHVAAAHPGRVKSLTLMMTTSGARSLPPPAPAVRRALLQRPRADDPAGALALMQQLLTLIASPAYPPHPQALRRRIAASIERAYRRRRPFAAASAHRGADAGAARPRRPAGARGRGARPGPQDPGRRDRGHPRLGPRPAAGADAAAGRRDRPPRRARGRLSRGASGHRAAMAHCAPFALTRFSPLPWTRSCCSSPPS
jgi:pimeloyl-ACP methyl ester carboxylesterase